nr:Wzz/FepE/Etk N-terminal domain-containing protein [Burkholderiaceae bacterium]
MIFGQLFRVMKARLGLILLIVAATVASAAAASFMMSKRYTAVASVVVNIPTSDPINGGAVYLPGTVAGLLATHVDLIKSDRVAQKVIDALGLTLDPQIQQEFREAGGVGDMRRWLSTKMGRELSVEAARESAFITLSYETKNPEVAAKATNAVANAFIDPTLGMKTEPAKNYAAQFEAQAKQYRQELAKAQEKLVQFQQQTGIITADQRLDVENTRLQELSTQLVQIQGLASESRSRQAAVQRSGRDSMPEVTSNGLIQQLKGELVRAESRYHDLSGQLGARHPQIIAITSDIESLKARIESETQRLTS